MLQQLRTLAASRIHTCLLPESPHSIGRRRRQVHGVQSESVDIPGLGGVEAGVLDFLTAIIGALLTPTRSWRPNIVPRSALRAAPKRIVVQRSPVPERGSDSGTAISSPPPPATPVRARGSHAPTGRRATALQLSTPPVV